jgi:hypothetical protein
MCDLIVRQKRETLKCMSMACRNVGRSRAERSLCLQVVYVRSKASAKDIDYRGVRDGGRKRRHRESVESNGKSVRGSCSAYEGRVGGQ